MCSWPICLLKSKRLCQLLPQLAFEIFSIPVAKMGKEKKVKSTKVYEHKNRFKFVLQDEVLCSRRRSTHSMSFFVQVPKEKKKKASKGLPQTKSGSQIALPGMSGTPTSGGTVASLQKTGSKIGGSSGINWARLDEGTNDSHWVILTISW